MKLVTEENPRISNPTLSVLVYYINITGRRNPMITKLADPAGKGTPRWLYVYSL